MANYTKVNFSDVENSAGDDREMRFARKYLNSDELGVTLMRYKPNFRAANAHSHKEQEEVYVVLKGSGRVLLDDEVEALSEWDVVRVASEVVRAFESGTDGLEILAIGGRKPAEGDGIRQDPNWPD